MIGKNLRVGLVCCVIASGCGMPVEAEQASEPTEVSAVTAPLLGSTCTPDDANELAGAVFDAWFGLQGLLQTSATPTADPVRWQRWFNVTDNASIQKVTQTMRTIIPILMGAKFICEYNGSDPNIAKECLDPRVYALIFPGENAIHFCDKFLLTGHEIQTNVLIHEGAHAALQDFNDYSNTTSAACLALATNNPAQAIINAGNYGHFVTNNTTLIR